MDSEALLCFELFAKEGCKVDGLLKQMELVFKTLALSYFRVLMDRHKWQSLWV